MGRSIRLRAALGGLAMASACAVASQALADYRPITLTMADRTVVLTGHDLTVDQVVAVARYGAKVALSPEAKQRTADTWGLMMEGAAEGMSIYLFNRGAGDQREIVQFKGDPLAAENKAYFEPRDAVLPPFKPAAKAAGPINPSSDELDHEDVARAIMVVRANQMTYLPASPQVMQALIDLINADITPVMRARGGTGEALGPVPNNISAAIRGGGEVWYHGVRMSAADALAKAGLKPTALMPGDATTFTVNADVAGPAALLVADAKDLLDWVDLAYAMDLDGMNSSITPLFTPVQINRPYRWITWDAARVLDMLKGSYLLQDEGDADPKIKRIIQDPESMRAGYVRQGAAWEEWGNLRDDVTVQINWSEHNPAVKIDASPNDSWELASPWAQRYYVKGGPRSNGKHGFIFSNANWDPYPLGNRLEAFTIALANLDVAVMLRQERFNTTFFTVVTAQEVLGPAAGGRNGAGFGGGGFGGSNGNNHEVYQRIQGLMNPVPPEGYLEDPEGVEELEAETLFKSTRAQQAVLESWTLVANDLNTGARWMDVRKAQVPGRTFGAPPTAALAAYRKSGLTAYDFVRITPATTFYATGPALPETAEPVLRPILDRKP